MRQNRKSQKTLYEEFVKELAKKSGLKKYELLVPNLTDQLMRTLYKWMVKEIKEGETHSFHVPGVGTFYKTVHKGHPLNLKIENGATHIQDYEVFKFKPEESFKDLVLGRESKHKSQQSRKKRGPKKKNSKESDKDVS